MKSLDKANQRLKISTIDLQVLRERKFLILYHHASKESPYYAKVFKDLVINRIDDLCKIPILTKDLLLKEYSNIICESDNIFFVPNSTSGSTGAATLFGIDSRSIINRDVHGIRSLEMSKSYRYLDKLLIFWGAERDISGKKDLRYYYNLR